MSNLQKGFQTSDKCERTSQLESRVYELEQTLKLVTVKMRKIMDTSEQINREVLLVNSRIKDSVNELAKTQARLRKQEDT